MQLGFSTSFTITPADLHDEACFIVCASYTISNINLVANVVLDMGADVSLSYEREDVIPGGSVPLQITYTPTDDAGNEASVDITGTATVDFTGCIDCPANIAFTAASGAGSFTAPLDGDANVNIAGSSSEFSLEVAGIKLASATIGSTLTLSAAAPVVGVAGLGGAMATVAVTGATLTDSDLTLPNGNGNVEWQTAGSTRTATIELPVSDGDVAITLSPVLHWLGTSANADLNLDIASPIDEILSDRSFNLLSGSLGPAYTQIGLDCLVGSSIDGVLPCGGPFGGGLVAGRVAAGFIPVPLLSPPLSAIPPVTLGSAVFTLSLDTDDDGLFDGTEIGIGTDPDDADTDNDGLGDGLEVDIGTNPLDADTDNDGLTDGAEVNVHHCNPLVTDTDGDSLTDFQEVNVYGTLCNDADTDNDELDDGLEVAHGTDPLNPDSDGDGIPDGEDVEWLQDAIGDLPDADFRNPPAHIKNAMLRILDDVEAAVAAGDTPTALDLLENLRRHLDGCGATADSNDWIVDCAAQVTIRDLIDLYVDNLTS